jgi:hypothetical protein
VSGPEACLQAEAARNKAVRRSKERLLFMLCIMV